MFAGEVKPRHESDLAFRIGGKVIARSVDVGARVTRGDVLARLDPADVGLQADAQKSAAAAAETEFRYAQSEYDRYQNLYRQKFISESALDQKRNALDTNRAKYEQAKAQLAVTRNQAGYATLVAPDNGVVTAVSVEAGQVVAAGQAVFRLAREDQREVAISVPENRVGELRRADTLGVVLWANPQKIYPARVREIAPAVDPVTRTFAVRVTVPERRSFGAVGHDGERRRAKPRARQRRAPAAHLDLPEGRERRGVGLRPAIAEGQPAAGVGRPIPRGRRAA